MKQRAVYEQLIWHLWVAGTLFKKIWTHLNLPSIHLQGKIRVFAKSRLRFGLQVRSKTKTKLIFGFIKVCKEQSVKYSVFDRKKLSFEIQVFQPQKMLIYYLKANITATSNYRGVEESGASHAEQQTGQVRLPGVTGNTPAPNAANNNGAALATASRNVMGGQATSTVPIEKPEALNALLSFSGMCFVLLFLYFCHFVVFVMFPCSRRSFLDVPLAFLLSSRPRTG